MRLANDSFFQAERMRLFFPRSSRYIHALSPPSLTRSSLPAGSFRLRSVKRKLVSAREQCRGLLVFLARYRKRFTFEVCSRARVTRANRGKAKEEGRQPIRCKFFLLACWSPGYGKSGSILPLPPLWNKFQSIDLEIRSTFSLYFDPALRF